MVEPNIIYRSALATFPCLHVLSLIIDKPAGKRMPFPSLWTDRNDSITIHFGSCKLGRRVFFVQLLLLWKKTIRISFPGFQDRFFLPEFSMYVPMYTVHCVHVTRLSFFRIRFWRIKKLFTPRLISGCRMNTNIAHTITWPYTKPEEKFDCNEINFGNQTIFLKK